MSLPRGNEEAAQKARFKADEVSTKVRAGFPFTRPPHDLNLRLLYDSSRPPFPTPLLPTCLFYSPPQSHAPLHHTLTHRIRLRSFILRLAPPFRPSSPCASRATTALHPVTPSPHLYPRASRREARTRSLPSSWTDRVTVLLLRLRSCGLGRSVEKAASADLSSAAHVHSGLFEEGGAPGVSFEEERVRHEKGRRAACLTRLSPSHAPRTRRRRERGGKECSEARGVGAGAGDAAVARERRKMGAGPFSLSLSDAKPGGEDRARPRRLGQRAADGSMRMRS
ncbi:hypothetical protein K438DRAFT_1988021 [Mycena galopus ATCC 62051]|nr:hypothetical protein K438DRAFT_1988021 [Mycena galopus ATCC 62051]